MWRCPFKDELEEMTVLGSVFKLVSILTLGS